VDFDVDGKAESAALIGRLGLPETLGWSSARGDHSLFLWDKRLEGLVDVSVAHFDGCELRVGGEGKQLVSVCPPSVGDDRRCRGGRTGGAGGGGGSGRCPRPGRASPGTGTSPGWGARGRPPSPPAAAATPRRPCGTRRGQSGRRSPAPGTTR